MENTAKSQDSLYQVSEPTPLGQIVNPIKEFLNTEAFGGMLLLACTIIALVWANWPGSHLYEDLWHHMDLSLGFPPYNTAEPLHFWINDALMVIFFFVVGLEIKREVLVGELSSLQQAALPIAAALGGMIVPAGIYFILNRDGVGSPGWGIPMATDIAFAIGILALMGDRVPLALKIFLTALAIVDDIGAVLVIAVFYTAEISWYSLAIAGIFLAALIGANRLGIRRPLIYGVLSIGLWLAFLSSGVHATIAGVLAAMTIPARTKIDSERFLSKSRSLLNEFEKATLPGKTTLSNRRQRAAVLTLEGACEEVQSPMRILEHHLLPWVTFLIIPLFALANAGVVLEGDFSMLFTNPITLGIILGLVVGKQIGISLFAWLAVVTGIAALPTGVTWRQIYGVSWLGGIGFTMSLFIGSLAFTDQALLDEAKIGILAASAIAGVVGYVIVSFTQRNLGRR